MARTTVYGYATRYPKSANEMKWETGGHEGENPEGSFRYIFSNADQQNPFGWRQPVYTRLDAEFFMSKPDDYKYEPISGRPENMRPQRPNPVEYFDKKVAEESPKIPVLNEMPPIPIEVPTESTPTEAPKHRRGRQKDTTPKLSELSLP